jgi:hypothetical protein
MNDLIPFPVAPETARPIILDRVADEARTLIVQLQEARSQLIASLADHCSSREKHP